MAQEWVPVLQQFVNVHSEVMNLRKFQESHVEQLNVQNVAHPYAVQDKEVKI